MLAPNQKEDTDFNSARSFIKFPKYNSNMNNVDKNDMVESKENQIA